MRNEEWASKVSVCPVGTSAKLKNELEMGGLTEHCDKREQGDNQTEWAMVVRLLTQPNEWIIPYLSALNIETLSDNKSPYSML